MINTSFSSCLKEVAGKEGISALYKGVTSPLLSVPFLRATGWLSLEMALMGLGTKFGNDLTVSHAMIGGAFSALATSIIVTPFDLVKCRLQMEGVGAKIKRTGSLKLAKNIIIEEGIRGLYRGYTLALLRDIPGLAVSFGTFQYTKLKLLSLWGDKTYNSLISGAFAGAVTWLFIYPQDLVKTRFQNGKQKTSQIVKEILAKDGLRGFWRGFGACMTRAPIAVACSYWTYDESKKILTRLFQIEP